MNIRNVNFSTERAENYRQQSVQESGKAGVAGDLQQSNGSVHHGAQDRVEISDAARAAVSDAGSSQEINFARKALLGIPPLSEKRVADIMLRIQNGFYSQPDVLRQIAEQITSDLGGLLA